MSEIQVKCCYDCPFATWGRYRTYETYICNHPMILDVFKVSTDSIGFPMDNKVHDDCPLKEKSLTISYEDKQNG